MRTEEHTSKLQSDVCSSDLITSPITIFGFAIPYRYGLNRLAVLAGRGFYLLLMDGAEYSIR